MGGAIPEPIVEGRDSLPVEVSRAVKKRFESKIAVVTGGASGIGRGIAQGLAREGASVLIGDLNAEAGGAVAGEIREIGGVAEFEPCDVSLSADCQGLMRVAAERWGRLDILVNSAGIGRGGAIAELSESTWDTVLDINLKGTFLCCQAAIPLMTGGGGGAILNLASLAAIRAAPGFGAYGPSKAGVVQFTGVLALETAALGIRANALAPVWIDTPMVDGYLTATGEPERARRELLKGIPLGRLGTVADVAAAGLFLLSDEASFLTGVVLPVDGGAQWA